MSVSGASRLCGRVVVPPLLVVYAATLCRVSSQVNVRSGDLKSRPWPCRWRQSPGVPPLNLSLSFPLGRSRPRARRALLLVPRSSSKGVPEGIRGASSKNSQSARRRSGPSLRCRTHRQPEIRNSKLQSDSASAAYSALIAPEPGSQIPVARCLMARRCGHNRRAGSLLGAPGTERYAGPAGSFVHQKARPTKPEEKYDERGSGRPPTAPNGNLRRSLNGSLPNPRDRVGPNR